jgi:hypothetical protein
MNTVIDLNYTGCFKINCAVKFICGGRSCHRGAAAETLDNLTLVGKCLEVRGRGLHLVWDYLSFHSNE